MNPHEHHSHGQEGEHQHSPSCAHTHHHAHGHHHGHGHHHHHHAEGNIRTAFLVNLLFCIIELVGGIVTGSIAILSDALHDFGDSVALGAAWYLERLSKKGRDKTFSYGYKRFSLMGSLLISIILLVGSFFVIEASIERIIVPGEPEPNGMLLLSILGLLINGFAAWRMSRGQSLNERSIRLHLMEDVLGWAAVLVVSIVMKIVYLPILDPILSLCITAWILYNVYHALKDNFRILLQGVPLEIDEQKFVAEITAIEAVLSVHDVHIWTLNGEMNIASLHIIYSEQKLGEYSNTAQLKKAIRTLAERYGIEHITIEIDQEGESCGMEHC